MKKTLLLIMTLVITGCSTQNATATGDADMPQFSTTAPAVATEAEIAAQKQAEENAAANKIAEEKFAAFCETAPCRKNLYFKLKQPTGKPLQYSKNLASPVIRNGVITVYPGEQIFIEADIDNNTLTNLVAVTENKHPAKTIVLQFWQTVDHENGLGMQLDVKNPFNKPLRYRLGIMPLGITPKIYKTSSCPVAAKTTHSERWPDPIFQIVLAEARLLDAKKDDMACAE